MLLSEHAQSKNEQENGQNQLKCSKLLNPIRTGVFDERASLVGGGCFSPLVKPRVIKFGTQLNMDKIYYEKQYRT